jgi:hypothetical protein
VQECEAHNLKRKVLEKPFSMTTPSTPRRAVSVNRPLSSSLAGDGSVADGSVAYLGDPPPPILPPVSDGSVAGGMKARDIIFKPSEESVSSNGLFLLGNPTGRDLPFTVTH